MIEYDCETTGVQPWSAGNEAFLYCFYDGDLAEALWPGQDDRRIQWWFDRGKREGLRAWNTKFDRAFGDKAGYDIPGDGMWHDGMVVAHAINERRSMALEAVATDLFGNDAAAVELKRSVKAWLTAERARRKKAAAEAGEELIEPNFSDVPRELIVPYGLGDVYLTRQVSEQHDPIIAGQPELASLIEFERQVLDALYAVEKRGLPASESGYRHLEQEVIANLDALEDRVLALARKGLGADADFNPNAPQQVIKALEARGADMSFMSTEHGHIKADKENLEAVDDELAQAILNYRAEYKVLSTYVRPMIGRHYDSGLRYWKEPFIGSDGRIHTNYRQVGARTGRMSSADPNMQNQPRDDLRLRYNIVADPGMKIVTCDLTNIEMRLFAAYAGNGRLLEAVRRGDDLHTLTAQFIGIQDRKRAGGAVESARQRGKTFNFSIIYGGGLRTIRRQQRVNQATARIMRKRYYDAYPEVEVLQNRIQWKLEEQGYIKDLWGRRYRCDNPRKEAYKFVNYLIQGSAAEILKAALVECHKAGIPVVGLVHDEILAHVPEADAREAQHTINEALVREAQPGGRLWISDKGGPIVPLDAEGDIVDRWSQAKKPDFVPKWAQ